MCAGHQTPPVTESALALTNLSAVKLLEAWLRRRNTLDIPGLAQQHMPGVGAHRFSTSERAAESRAEHWALLRGWVL